MLGILFLFYLICFCDAKSAPFDTFLEFVHKLPVIVTNQTKTIPGSDTKFYLFTRQNVDYGVELSDVTEVFINKNKEFRYITHGYMEDIFKPHYLKLKNALLVRGDYNVILVDWRKTSLDEYSRASLNTRYVGKAIGHHILANNIPLDRTELIGLSLGAHIMGFAGKYIEEKSINKIWRIVALDTSGPLFEFNDMSKSLAPSDARNVMAIHTDGRLFGMFRPTGTIDFYINGGAGFQPGCEQVQIPKGITINDFYNAGYFTILCNHGRSIQYYTEAVNSNKFVATKCQNYFFYTVGLCYDNQKVVMGEDTPDNVKGIFQIKISSTPPSELQFT